MAGGVSAVAVAAVGGVVTSGSNFRFSPTPIPDEKGGSLGKKSSSRPEAGAGEEAAAAAATSTVN